MSASHGTAHAGGSEDDTVPPGGPLAGIRVIDLTSVLMGPYCTQILADLGADVIKVESPYGDTTRRLPGARTPGMSGMFVNVNRNKRGIVLDLKRSAGRKALIRLAATADVFAHSMRTDAIGRLQLDYPALARANPSIVYLNVYGFSRRGTRSNDAAYDDTIQSISGLAHLQERLIGRPNFVSTVVADKTTAMTAAWAVLAALLHRARTGEGQEVEVGMYESMVSYLMVEHIGGQLFEPPIEPRLYERAVMPSRRPFRTADGCISVTVYTDEHFAAFATLVGDPEWAADPRYASLEVRWRNIDGFYLGVESHLARRPTAWWLDALRDAGIPAAPVHSFDDVRADPHLREQGWFEATATKEGTLRFPGIPAWFSRTPVRIREAGPRHGEHTVEVLREAGLDQSEIDGLLREGVAMGAQERSQGAPSPEA
jgi:crotonobetainyl-CoA:carnitine CoA-transferase CaiB-like acyl-CoA transferase